MQQKKKKRNIIKNANECKKRLEMGSKRLAIFVFSVRDQTLNLNKDEYKEKSDENTKKQGDDNRVKEMSQGKAKMKNKTKNDEAR